VNHWTVWSIKANAVESSSSMNVGTNILIGFGSSTKSTQGYGQISGDHGQAPTLWTHVDDQDLIDTPNWEVGPGGHMIIPPNIFGFLPTQ
jgi:hypothetical protein